MTRNELNDLRAIILDKKIKTSIKDTDSSIIKAVAYNEALSKVLIELDSYANGLYPKETIIILRKKFNQKEQLWWVY